jgi:8-oxo-dGTP diphosphatase
MPFTYAYPRPAVTVDVILITSNPVHKILLIQRKNSPYKNTWAFPGGFLDMHEDLHTAALRELEEETGVCALDIHQFKTYGAIDRDPRGRTITVVYYAFVQNEIPAYANDDAKKAQWFNLNSLPELAFDHAQILADLRNTLAL